MKIKLTSVLLACSSSLLLACSDQTAPSEKNYRAPIENYFATRDDFPHCFFNYQFPAEFNEQQLKFSGVANKLKLLHELGLLEFRSKTVGEQFGKPKKYYGYNVSEQGRAYYSDEKGFCIGKAKLLDLKDVSKPYEERGKTYVRGTYTWTVELPDWALQSKFYQSKEFSSKLWYIKYKKILSDEHREDFFTLSLNEDGWGF